ncbi:MAG TPA: DNA internalization-related competence protein ComEC/Rec2 [Thermodesulfobacteriaceae bacterium]|nr:DNA internalization-related competence protein ComEC/Rec2 [Thermodesulfobacteriaceae bacterium]
MPSVSPCPLGALILPFVLGIIFARFHPGLSSPAIAPVLFTCSVLLTAFTAFTWKRSVDRRRLLRILSGAGAFVSLFVLGGFHLHSSLASLKESSSGLLRLADRPGRHVMTGQVIRAPAPARDGIRLLVSLSEINSPTGDKPLTGRLSLKIRGIRIENISPGDWIRFSAGLRKVRNFHTPGSFDYETWCAVRRILVKGFVDTPLRVCVTGHSRHSANLSLFRHHLEFWRHRIMITLKRSMAQPGRGIAAALLTGEKAWLTPEIREAFAMAGIGHLLAVSGIHMALAAALTGGLIAMLLLRFEWIILRFPVKKISISAALAASVCYAGLAGFSPSATRAMVMISAFGTAFLLDRPQTPLNSLSAAAWVLLIMDPLHLFGISFQLSFAAVFFLILFSPYFSMEGIPGTHGNPNLENHGIHPESSLSRRLVKALTAWLIPMLLITLTATAATAPVTAWHFQRVSVAGILSNIIMVPLTSFLILPVLLVGAFTVLPAPDAAGALFRLLQYPLDNMAILADRVAGWSWSSYWIPRPAAILVFLIYLFLGALALSFHCRRLRKPAVICLALLTLCSAFQKWQIRHREGIRLHVLDVGQGTAQVVELPGGGLMVVDGGGTISPSFDIGRRVVGPFIRQLGYCSIDVIVASHPEMDHAGGLAALVHDFPVGELWTNGDTSHGIFWKRLMAACSVRGVTHHIFNESETRYFGDTRIDITGPSRCSGLRSRNSRSLVICLSHHGKRILMTGDIDRAREQCLVSSGLGPSDVLTVPHHGSITSSSRDFIAATGPDIAIVSAGWRNRFGLPSPEIINRYREAGTRIYRTDLDGTVTVKLEQDKISVHTFLPHP